MSIAINSVEDISKLLAFVRGVAKGKFRISMFLLKKTIKELEKYAKDKKITLELVDASGELIIKFTRYGAYLGAAAGFLMGSISGALIGAAVGASLGYLAAQVRITISVLDNQNEFELNLN